jgi:hypothetical protein
MALGDAGLNEPPVHKGAAFVTGGGKAVESAVIEGVRLADGIEEYGVKSMLGVWTAFPPDGPAHKNVTARRFVSMGSGKDGMHIHGPVDGFTGEDMYIERANGDALLLFGRTTASAAAVLGLGLSFPIDKREQHRGPLDSLRYKPSSTPPK